MGGCHVPVLGRSSIHVLAEYALCYGHDCKLSSSSTFPHNPRVLKTFLEAILEDIFEY
jgi:hypothetical protein